MSSSQNLHKKRRKEGRKEWKWKANSSTIQEWTAIETFSWLLVDIVAMIETKLISPDVLQFNYDVWFK